MKTTEAIRKIKESARIDKEKKDATDLPVNFYVAQGDVMVWRINEWNDIFDLVDFADNVQLDNPSDFKATKDRKIAQGDSKGSRHIVLEPYVKIDNPSENTILHGPRIESEKEWTLTHPEHCDFILPAGRFVVTYNLDRRTMRRVRD